MRDYIARLVKCGMPRDIAVCICRSYARKGDWHGLYQYVYSVEEEVKERDDGQWQEW